MQGVFLFPKTVNKQDSKQCGQTQKKNVSSENWTLASSKTDTFPHSKRRSHRFKKKRMPLLRLLYCFIFCGAFGIGIGAFLCLQDTEQGRCFRDFASAYQMICAGKFSIHIYANLFLYNMIPHLFLLLYSFSCLGFIPSGFLLVGKGIAVGSVMISLLQSTDHMEMQLIRQAPYLSLSFVLALFMAFVSAKQSARLFQIHFLNKKNINYTWRDGFYFFAVITALSFLCPLSFAL